MAIIENPSHSIFREQIFQRLLFFTRVLFMLFLNFILFLGYSLALNSLSLPPIADIIAFWCGYAITTSLAASIGFFIGKRISPNPLHQFKYSLWSPLKLNRANWASQIKYMAMLLFLVYIPLDFLGYCIPGMLEYSAQSLLDSSTGGYLSWDLQIMLPIAAIVHFCVAFREEFLLRNFFLTTAEASLEKSTSLIYASISFGLAHFNYIFAGISNGLTIIHPILWGLFATIIGLMAAYFFLEKRMLWALIIAHWLNNIISAIALQQHLAGQPFIRIATVLYFPLLLISVIILIVKYRSVSRTIVDCWRLLKSYIEINKGKDSSVPILSPNKISKRSDQTANLSIPIHHEPLIFYILIDLFFLILLWISSLFLF